MQTGIIPEASGDGWRLPEPPAELTSAREKARDLSEKLSDAIRRSAELEAKRRNVAGKVANEGSEELRARLRGRNMLTITLPPERP